MTYAWRTLEDFQIWAGFENVGDPRTENRFNRFQYIDLKDTSVKTKDHTFGVRTKHFQNGASRDFGSHRSMRFETSLLNKIQIKGYNA